MRSTQAKTAPWGRKRLQLGNSWCRVGTPGSLSRSQLAAEAGSCAAEARARPCELDRSDSKSFSEGRALASRSFQSSAETSTAACFPRFVTIWGPSESAFSSISLKRAFASWTCHVGRGGARLLILSSHISSQVGRQASASALRPWIGHRKSRIASLARMVLGAYSAFCVRPEAMASCSIILRSPSPASLRCCSRSRRNAPRPSPRRRDRTAGRARRRRPRRASACAAAARDRADS